MLEILITLDKALFIFLNSLHHPFIDPVMLLITGKLTWLPLYVFILWCWIKHYQKDSWKPILGIALVILLSDQTASGFFKPTFMRLRPCHEPDVMNVSHLVGTCGGQFGFVSSHAANTFGLAFFGLLLGRVNTQKHWVYLLLWAFLVTYSRVYVGVHYPADVLVGGLIGVFWAWLVFRIWQLIENSAANKQRL